MLKLRFVFLAFVLFTVTLNYSCKKEVENTIDCIFQPAYFTLKHTVDAQDTKKVNFEITYTGEHALDNSVAWNFGDGTTKTVNGTTAEHTYSASGTYSAKANVTVRNGDSYCTIELDESVTIN